MDLFSLTRLLHYFVLYAFFPQLVYFFQAKQLNCNDEARKKRTHTNCSKLRCTFRYLSCGKLHSEYEESWHIFCRHCKHIENGEYEKDWLQFQVSQTIDLWTMIFLGLHLTQNIHSFTRKSCLQDGLLHRWHAKMQKTNSRIFERCHTNEGNFSAFAECKHCLRSFIRARRRAKMWLLLKQPSLCTNILYVIYIWLYLYIPLYDVHVHVCVVLRMYKW